MSTGSILEIHIAEPDAKPQPRESVELKAGQGIVGDRYFDGTGTFSKKLEGKRKREITFIAAEEVDRFNAETGEGLAYGELRRNVITRGVKLGELVGKTFTIGPATFQGMELCEPCAHLAATVNSKVLPHLVHTGLRAAILNSGTIRVGDTLVSN